MKIIKNSLIQQARIREFNHGKIAKRLAQTEKNNKKKGYSSKFNLRACTMEEIPLKSLQLMQRSPHLEKLKELDLSEMGLRRIISLPNFLFLIKLDLTMNYVNDQHIDCLLKFEKLQVLFLTENNIRFVETVRKLAWLQEIKQLDVSANPVQYDSQQIFGRFKKLAILDRYTKTGVDLERNTLLDDDSGDQSQEQVEDYNQDARSAHEKSDIVLSDMEQEVSFEDNRSYADYNSYDSQSIDSEVKYDSQLGMLDNFFDDLQNSCSMDVEE